MRKLLFVLILMLSVVLVGCSTSSTFNPKKEIVEVERILAKVDEMEEFAKELDKEGQPTLNHEDDPVINISLKEFLYNYYELSEEKDLEMMSVDDSINYSTIVIGSYPSVSITFHRDGDKKVTFVGCVHECTDAHKESIKEALKLSKMKYDKDYTIDEGYEKDKDGELYDYFGVKGVK